MSFIENDQELMAKVAAARSPVEKLALLATSALEGEAAMRNAVGMERAEIALRVGATQAVMTSETDNDEAAKNTVLWAGRCVDVARHFDAAIVYYVPRAAALCACVLDHLGSGLQALVMDTMGGWMHGYGKALERVASHTADADGVALVALAAQATEGADDLASQARERASAGYRAVGDFDTFLAASSGDKGLVGKFDPNMPGLAARLAKDGE